MQIRVPNQTANGVCYLRIGYDAYSLKDETTNRKVNRNVEVFKKFIEMIHVNCS